MRKDLKFTADLFIIGGGINGTGIAADAAGRGLKVVLCEADDLASGTSSWSSKLIHGGLRYLEQYEFKLVREALKEREILLQKAPHLVQPLPFILPYDTRLRPKWLIRAGLFLYDHLGGKQSMPKSKQIDLQHTAYGKALKNSFKTGFRYYDCRVDDARLVTLNAITAKTHGAEIFTRTPCVQTKRCDEHWEAILKPENAEAFTVQAKSIINAGGPWVSSILHEVIDTESKANVNLVKGSHIVVPKLYEGDFAYILQNDDKRIVFTIPYLFEGIQTNKYTLIGTTDLAYQGERRKISISEEETEYLCNIIKTYFKKPIQKSDILWSYAGVRPLFDDNADNPSKVTREYHLELEDWQGKTPLLSVFGGKITTFRKLAEDALSKLARYFPEMRPSWTAKSKLPGGEIKNFETFYIQLHTQFPFLTKEHTYRLANSYGSIALTFLENCKTVADLGRHFGADLYACEVHYLLDNEWAKTADDIIWRRTKLGLGLTEMEVKSLGEYLANLNIKRGN